MRATQANRLAPMLILLASIAVLGTALLSQFVGGLLPCELCLYERWPYYAILVVMVLAMLNRATKIIRLALTLAALIFLGSSALAAYHVGVEQHWIEGPTACTGDLPASSPEALLRALEGRQPVQCDVVQWSFHGISLAGLNLAVSLALAAFSLWAVTWRRADARR
jgi:disulfide bond formation protein DsbB